MRNKTKNKNTVKMVKYVKKGFILSSLTLCMLLSSSNAAELNFAKTFDGMMNTTSAGAYHNARRGVINGGSISFRLPILDVSIASLTMPEIRGGCGGIDLFGGSFSFINKEQFVALLKSVGMNAISYAASLALKTICEQCFVVMEIIQKKIQEMNAFLGNSCQLAQGLVHDGLNLLPDSKFGQKMQTKQASNASAWGAGKDFFTSITSTPGELYTASKGIFDWEDQSSGSPVGQMKIDTGNLLWEAYWTKAAVAGTTVKANLEKLGFSDDGNKIGRFLLSLAGTFIILQEEHGKNKPTSVHGILDFGQILYGDGGKYNPKATKSKLTLYKCKVDEQGQNVNNGKYSSLYQNLNSVQNGGENTCTQMEASDKVDYNPLVNDFKEILFGANGGGGLVHKFAQERNILALSPSTNTTGTVLTDKEKRLIESMNSGYGSMVRNIAVFDENAAREFASKYMEILAADVVFGMMKQVFQGIQIIASLNTGTYSNQLNKRIADSKEYFENSAGLIMKNLGSISDAKKDYKAYMEAFTKDRLNGMTADDFVKAVGNKF